MKPGWSLKCYPVVSRNFKIELRQKNLNLFKSEDPFLIKNRNLIPFDM